MKTKRVIERESAYTRERERKRKKRKKESKKIE